MIIKVKIIGVKKLRFCKNKIFPKFEIKNINKIVKNWIKNLFFTDKFLKSSIKLYIASGKQNTKDVFPSNNEPKLPIKTNIIPPPLGLGVLWELLFSGLSKR